MGKGLGEKRKPEDRMSDELLDHMCKLSVIAISSFRDPELDLRDLDDGEWRNTRNMISIVADTCSELMKRQGIMPHFRRAR